MEAILEFARQLYRAAQEVPAESFSDAALAALGTQIRFEAAVWFTGALGDGTFQFHRVHLFRLPQEVLKQIVPSSRMFYGPLEVSARCPGQALQFYAPDLYAAPENAPALECARRLGLERQLLIAHMDGEPGSREWLSLHRPAEGRPFSETDGAVLRLLMPHLSEARAVSRTLCMRRASSEPLFAPRSHRALTLLDGTVLHCGRQISDSIASQWPDWNQIHLPAPLLEDLTCNGSVAIAPRGESILARLFTDYIALTVRNVPLAERLTRREYDMARLFGDGTRYHEIARRRRLSPTTVRNVVQKVYRKLGINSKVQLVQLLRESARE